MRIDGWTLLLQALNLLVLLALLRWLFYRPLLAVIEARRQAVNEVLAQARAERDKAAADAEALARERAGAEATREQVLQAARVQAEAERQARAQEAQRNADQALQDARAQLAREREQVTEALFGEASQLAIHLAGRLLAATPADDSAFVQDLLARLAATPPVEREAWFAEGVARSVTLCTAHPLDAPRQQALRADLIGLLGDATEVALDVNPALLAGAELSFPHGTLSLNWAAELKAAGQALPGTTRVGS